MKKPSILALSGSIRSKSTNNGILRYIKQHFNHHFDIELYEGIAALPHFNPDMDTDIPPKEVQLLRKKIAAADGVLICTPEYVFSIPGSLKNALEWNVSNTLFLDKPVALVIAAASGEKALESLQLIMKTLGAQIQKDAALLIQSPKGKLKGTEITDAKTCMNIQRLMEALGDSLVATNNE